MHDSMPVLTLAAALAAALALGYVTHRLGLSPIVGYLLAGVAIGPNTPGLVADKHLADQLAEVGVVLLMFGVGLHSHLNDLLAVRRVAVPGAVVQIGAATALGAGAAVALGWGWPAALVFGLSVSVASTVVVTRVLGDRNELHTPLGLTAVGWLVVQDIYAVFVLVLLPPLLGAEAAGRLAQLVALAGLKIAALVGLVLVVGGRVIPWLLRQVAAVHSRELFTLTVLVVALGIAVGSATVFGVSMALGALLAGMVVGRSDFSLRAATDALPMRDAFAVLFFVSVGMLFDPAHLVKSPGPVLATLAVVMLGTPLVTCATVLVLGRPVRTAVGLGLAFAQIGEFSFILAGLGKALGALPDTAFHAIVAAAIVSISVNPLVYRLAGPIDRWVARRPRLARRLAARVRLERAQVAAATAEPQHRAVVVGYGPVGRTLTRLLRENGIAPTVIEMSLETVKWLRAEGVRAVYGDANHPETLREAGVDRAGTLFLSASGLTGAEEVVREAKELNPGLRVVARSAYLRGRAALRKAGADEVYAGEGEVALAMTESVLRVLGATPDQIDRERERVRAELLGPTAADNAPPQATPPANG